MIKKTLKFVTSFLIACILLLTVLGFLQYRQVIKTESIENKIINIQNNLNYVPINHISTHLINATIAIEDKRFYEHGGIDPFGLIRAARDSINAGGIVGGGSTITQQLAKNMYFSHEPSLIRKIAEMFVAFDLERNYEKDTILECYLNIINYGDNYFGIKEASEGYYHNMPSKLTLDQASTLAGIPQSPSNLQLSNESEYTKLKQKAVLEAMVREEMIPQILVDEIISK